MPLNLKALIATFVLLAMSAVVGYLLFRLSKTRTKSLELTFSNEGFAQVSTLMEEAGLQSQRDLYNSAFTLLKWAVEKRKAGASIGALNVDAEGERFVPVKLSFLENIAGPSKTDAPA